MMYILVLCIISSVFCITCFSLHIHDGQPWKNVFKLEFRFRKTSVSDIYLLFLLLSSSVPNASRVETFGNLDIVRCKLITTLVDCDSRSRACWRGAVCFTLGLPWIQSMRNLESSNIFWRIWRRIAKNLVTVVVASQGLVKNHVSDILGAELQGECKFVMQHRKLHCQTGGSKLSKVSVGLIQLC